jgi:hypothetical protein
MATRPVLAAVAAAGCSSKSSRGIHRRSCSYQCLGRRGLPCHQPAHKSRRARRHYHQYRPRAGQPGAPGYGSAQRARLRSLCRPSGGRMNGRRAHRDLLQLRTPSRPLVPRWFEVRARSRGRFAHADVPDILGPSDQNIAPHLFCSFNSSNSSFVACVVSLAWTISTNRSASRGQTL